VTDHLHIPSHPLALSRDRLDASSFVVDAVSVEHRVVRCVTESDVNDSDSAVRPGQ